MFLSFCLSVIIVVVVVVVAAATAAICLILNVLNNWFRCSKLHTAKVDT